MAKPGFKASVSPIVPSCHPKVPSVCRALSCLNQYLAWRSSHKKRKAKRSPSLPRFKDQFPGNFLDSSVGKESACNAGDPGLIPGSGRVTGEGIGYPLRYSWASLLAQLVKNPPAMWETWVQFLGWEDPLEKGKATHSSILAWRIPWTVRWRVKKLA